MVYLICCDGIFRKLVTGYFKDLLWDYASKLGMRISNEKLGIIVHD